MKSKLSRAERYKRVNQAWHAHQRRRYAEKLEGFNAQRAFGGAYDRPPVPPGASHAWATGWRVAASGGSKPTLRLDDLCPGVLGAPKHVGRDPEHITGHLEWACPTCGWRISPDGPKHLRRPDHVPVHAGPWPGVKSCSPIGGSSVDDFFREDTAG